MPENQPSPTSTTLVQFTPQHLFKAAHTLEQLAQVLFPHPFFYGSSGGCAASAGTTITSTRVSLSSCSSRICHAPYATPAAACHSMEASATFSTRPHPSSLCSATGEAVVALSVVLELLVMGHTENVYGERIFREGGQL